MCLSWVHGTLAWGTYPGFGVRYTYSSFPWVKNLISHFCGTHVFVLFTFLGSEVDSPPSPSNVAVCVSFSLSCLMVHGFLSFGFQERHQDMKNVFFNRIPPCQENIADTRYQSQSTVADSGSPGGPAPPLPPRFLQNQFPGIFKRKTPILGSGPPWGQNSTAPLTKIVDPPLPLLSQIYDI